MSEFFRARPQRNAPPRPLEDEEDDDFWDDGEDHGGGVPEGFEQHDDSDTEAIQQALQTWDKEGIRTEPFYMAKKKKKEPPKVKRVRTAVEVTPNNVVDFMNNESLDEDDYDAGRASLFRHLYEEDLKHRRPPGEDDEKKTTTKPHTTHNPILADRQVKQRKALLKLQALVPKDTKTKVQWAAAAQTQANKAGYDHLKLKSIQVEASVRAPQPNLQPFYRAFWSAAARPPWPDVATPETQRPPLPLGALMSYVEGEFKAKPGGLLVVHSPNRVALLCDYEMDALRLVVAVILIPANAAAVAQAACTAGTLHNVELPAPTPGKEKEAIQEQSHWRFVGMTLADHVLIYPPVV